MNFIPDQPKAAQAVPCYEDVTSDAGWQGQTTDKTIETLKSEITTAISRLGGLVIGFTRGKFMMDKKERQGFQIRYTIETNEKLIPGRMDIAALPNKPRNRNYRQPRISYEERSLRMSLYMFRNAIDGLWFLQQLSPGYAALMPFMLGDENRTISQIWNESSNLKAIMPPADSEFIDGEVREVKP